MYENINNELASWINKQGKSTSTSDLSTFHPVTSQTWQGVEGVFSLQLTILTIIGLYMMSTLTTKNNELWVRKPAHVPFYVFRLLGWYHFLNCQWTHPLLLQRGECECCSFADHSCTSSLNLYLVNYSFLSPIFFPCHVFFLLGSFIYFPVCPSSFHPFTLSTHSKVKKHPDHVISSSFSLINF